jgi:D-alanine-D-alanine ligase
MKKTIALIYGGEGAEHDVSVMGYNNLRRILDKDKYSIIDVFINRSGDWYIMRENESYPTFPVRMMGKQGFLKCGKIVSCDCAFPLLHGDMGEDGNIQGLLRSAGIPYVGEKTRVGSLTSDKSDTKLIARSLDIPTARWHVFRKNTDAHEAAGIAEENIGYPMFIKPTGLGSSVGASAVRSREDFFDAFKKVSADLMSDVLVEELITDKRELEVAYINISGNIITTAPSEIILGGTYGYDEKYKLGTKTAVCANVPEYVNQTLQEYSRRLITGIGLSSMSRIDFFLSCGKIMFNEINTMPGFTKDSLYLRMLDYRGISPIDAIDALIDRALTFGT